MVEKIIKGVDLSSTKLSKKLGVPAPTIRDIWRRNGIYKSKTHIFNPPKEELAEKLDKLGTYTAVGDYYDVNRKTVARKAKEYGLKSSKRANFTQQEINYIINNYHNKDSVQLAKEMNCSRSAITVIWYKANLSGKTYREYDLNEDYFKKLNTATKSYFVGFIMGDGCIYDRDNGTEAQKMISISINKRDIEILRELKNELNTDKPIQKLTVDNENGTKSDLVSIQIVSDRLCKQLQKFNIVERKTYKSTTFENIPDKYKSDLIRGLFDADGCIQFRNEGNWRSDFIISFCGSKETMEYVKRFLLSIGVNDISIKQDKREKYLVEHFYIGIYRNSYKLKLYKAMYYNQDVFCLSRKHQVFREFLKADYKGRD